MEVQDLIANCEGENGAELMTEKTIGWRTYMYLVVLRLIQ